MTGDDELRPGAERRARLRVAALLLAALAVVYANVIFGGRSLVATDNYNPMWPQADAQTYGPGFDSPLHWRQRGLLPYAGFYDAGAAWWIWEPGAPFLVQALARGEMPFWNPYNGAGTPAMANLSQTFFFPPWLLVVLSGASSTGKTFYLLAMLFCAGFCTYLFLRRAGLREAGATAGALAFQVSGALNSVIISMGGQALACIPFVMWLTRLFLDRPSAGRAALLALGYATAALASSPPILLLGFGFAVLYALTVIVTERATWGTRLDLLARFAGGAVLALGLVAWYYLPALELIRASTYVRLLYSRAAEQAFPVATLLQLLSSDLLGGSWIYSAPVTRDLVPWHMHASGVCALFAALLSGGGGSARRRALAWLSAGVTLVMLAKVVGLPPVQWLWSLPVFRNLHYAVYSSFLLHFVIAVLAGVGFERLWRGELRARRTWITAALLAVALVFILLVARSLGLGPPLRPGVVNWIYRYVMLWVFLGGLTFAARALVAAGATARRRAFAAGLLAFLAIAEGVHNLSFPRQRRVDVWRHPPPHVRALTGLADGRRFAHYAAFTANTNAAFGLFSVDSMDSFNSGRLVEVYQRWFKGPQQQFLREMGALAPDPVLDRAGIGWLVLNTSYRAWLDEARRRGYTQHYQDDWATVFRRPSGLRFLVTPDWRALGAAQVMDEIATAPWLQVLLEEPASFPARPFDHAADVKVAFFRNNAYALDVTSPGPALLYCAESHMPGWTATVDGRPARLLAANYAFRALEVPAGRSRVELRYVPPGWRAGVRVAGASLLLLAGLLLSAWRARRRPSPPVTP